MPALSIDTDDDPLLTESCETFVGGQNSFTRSSLVPTNQATLLENVTILIGGEVEKRRGTRNVFSGYVAGFDNIIQSLLYFDSVSTDRLVAFSNGKTYYYDGIEWQLYFDASIADINERIDSVQLTDLIYWTDSTETGVRKWNGSAVSTVGTSPVATLLETHTNRLIASGVSAIPDAVYFSNILNGDTWDMTNGVTRVGGGKGDPVVAIKSWQDTMIVVLCRQSTHIIMADPTLSVANMPISKVSNVIGCVAKRSVCQVGQDMWFLSRNGVMSIQKQIATSTNMVAVPMSQLIQDVVENIRWDQAHKSCALCYNNFYLLSVPVNSDEPDTVIAFHYLTGGFTIFTGWRASTFAEQPFSGTTRALMGCDSGEVREWLDYLHDEEIEPELDFKDGLNSITLPFTLPTTFPPGFDTESTIVTRGMVFGDPMSTKMGWYLELEIVQGSGMLDVYAILDGEQTVKLRSYTMDSTTFTLPLTLPFTLPPRSSWVKKKIPLHQLRSFYEIQIKLVSISGEMKLRRVAVSAMINAYQAQEN